MYLCLHYKLQKKFHKKFFGRLKIVWGCVCENCLCSQPPGQRHSTTPPMISRTQSRAMYKTYYIAGVLIIAKSLTEAYAYYRNYCKWFKGLVGCQTPAQAESTGRLQSLCVFYINLCPHSNRVSSNYIGLRTWPWELSVFNLLEPCGPSGQPHQHYATTRYNPKHNSNPWPHHWWQSLWHFGVAWFIQLTQDDH